MRSAEANRGLDRPNVLVDILANTRIPGIRSVYRPLAVREF